MYINVNNPVSRGRRCVLLTGIGREADGSDVGPRRPLNLSTQHHNRQIHKAGTNNVTSIKPNQKPIKHFNNDEEEYLDNTHIILDIVK